MNKIIAVTELRQCITQWRKAGEHIAFVPTMGNLHQGHLSLVSKAKELADKVIVSIFVNPLQFDEQSDLSAYPRTLDADIAQLSAVECDAVFIPPVDEIYPTGMDGQTIVTVPNMDDKLCGQARAGHFDGVATVVAKLFNLVQPDLAIFGEKDYQQLLLIKKMVFDLNLPIEIKGLPTFREKYGLAMSSRNQYLTEQQRELASSLYRILNEIRIKLEGGSQNFFELEQQAIAELKQLGFEPDYVDIRQAGNLEPVKPSDKELRILLAARLGQARLIDNISCVLD